MYNKPLVNDLDFHVALQDTLRKSNDLFHSRALLNSLYTPKFSNRRLSDDTAVLDPKARENIICYPNAASSINYKTELHVLEEFAIKNPNLGIWMNGNPATLRGDVRIALQNNADFRVAYPSHTPIAPIFVERDFKVGQINKGNLTVSGHVHSVRFDTTTKRLFGVEELKYPSFDELHSRYRQNFLRFVKNAKMANLVTYDESNIMANKFNEIDKIFDDTNLSFVERVNNKANKELLDFGGTDIAVRTRFNACILQLSEKRDSDFLDRPPLTEGPYSCKNPFLENNSSLQNREAYGLAVLNLATANDLNLKRNIEHSVPTFKPFSKVGLSSSWQSTDQDTIDTDVFF